MFTHVYMYFQLHVCTCIHACALITDQQISVLHVVCVCVCQICIVMCNLLFCSMVALLTLAPVGDGRQVGTKSVSWAYPCCVEGKNSVHLDVHAQS